MKNPNKVTLKTLVKTVRDIVRERPDVMYTAKYVCSYTEGTCTDSSVGCLIGQALVKLGVTFDNDETTKRISTLIQPLCDDSTRELMKYNNAASIWLAHVQSAQDRKEVWSDCITDADISVGRTEGLVP